MRVLRRLSVEELLTAWGRHEALGRFRNEIPPDILRLIDEDGPEGRRCALEHGRFMRAPVIAAIQASRPMLRVEIEVTADDLSALRVMCLPTDPPCPLSDHAERLLVEAGGAGHYVRELATGQAQVAGPIVAVGRTVPGPITILDGIHRGSAWVGHLRAGRFYPLTIAVIVTLQRTRFESEQEP